MAKEKTIVEEKKVKLEDTPETRKKMLEEGVFNLSFKGPDLVEFLGLLGELPASKIMGTLNSINQIVANTITKRIQEHNASLEEVKAAPEEESMQA